MSIDYSQYPHDWLSVIRPLILRRAGENKDKRIEARCELCNVENNSYRQNFKGEAHEPTKIVLTIAHLDQDPLNNDPDNLAALCQRCHLKWDRPFNLIKSTYSRNETRRQTLLPFDQQPERLREMSKKRLTHSFNVMMSHEDIAMLQEIADKYQLNKSHVLRQALRARYDMEIKHVAVCANSRPCFVPHMHIQQPTPSPAAPHL